jgi:cytochrome c-type biogenesis protein CcmH/NrfG
MAQRPHKKPRRNRPPSVNQRLAAQSKRSIAGPSGKPNRPSDIRVDKAQLAWEQGRYDEAIRHYEAAVARHPRNAVLLVDLARAYALRFRYPDAEKLITLAESLYPEDADLLKMLGRSFVMVQQFDRAVACFRRSLELQPEAAERPAILMELAKMHERLHQLAEARASIDEVLRLTPDNHAARYLAAIVHRRSGDRAAAEASWQQLIAAPGTPPGIVADSHYELAVLADAAGEFASAFDHLARAKAILTRAGRQQREDAESIAAVSRKTFAAVTAEHFQRWHAAGADLKPLAGRLALLASHPRSGTTLLEQVLDAHPAVTSADEVQVMAEVVYGSLRRKFRGSSSVIEALDKITVDDVNELRRSYWSSMEGAVRQSLAGRLLVDKNPELTTLLPVIARIFPEMKIIFALRDPRDVVLSCFMQRLPLNPVSVHYLTVESTARKYVSSMRGWLKVREMLGNSWIEVKYEDTVAHLEQQARQTLKFLDLPWHDGVLEYHRRAQQKHVHSPTYEAVTKPVYSSSVGRWRNYHRQLEPALRLLQPYVEAFGYA